jgi:hypothetical protein
MHMPYNLTRRRIFREYVQNHLHSCAACFLVIGSSFFSTKLLVGLLSKFWVHTYHPPILIKSQFKWVSSRSKLFENTDICFAELKHLCDARQTCTRRVGRIGGLLVGLWAQPEIFAERNILGEECLHVKFNLKIAKNVWKFSNTQHDTRYVVYCLQKVVVVKLKFQFL